MRNLVRLVLLIVIMQDIKMIGRALQTMFLCFYARHRGYFVVFQEAKNYYLSTSEAEFVVATAFACQTVWLKRILEELQFKQEREIVIFCDNNSAIKLSKNHALHGRIKHIDVKFFF